MTPARRALLFAALLPVAAFATDYVNDPLTSASAAGRGNQGGTFGPTGWTTTAANDSVWWEINTALPSGSIEFSITGMELGTSLVAGDCDLLNIYQAPGGMAEPVAYNPYFRNNDMKVFV